VNLELYIGYEYGLMNIFKVDISKVLINIEDLSNVKNRKYQPVLSIRAHQKMI